MWDKSSFVILSSISGFVLALGITRHNTGKMQKRIITIAGTVIGTVIGVVYNLKEKPLLLSLK